MLVSDSCSFESCLGSFADKKATTQLYIPAALRLLFTLENKKRRFSRSIRSLRVLDDIVSGDREITDDFKVKQDNEKNLRQSRMDAELGLGIQIAARSTYSPRLKGFSHSPPSSPGLGVSVYSGKDPLSHGTETTSSAHFGSELELVKDMPDSEKKSEAAWSTESLDNPLKKDGLEKERNLLKKVREKKAEHDRLKMEEKNSASKQKASRSAAHIDDLQRQLGRTERMFKTILVQFIVTLAIYLPYFSLLGQSLPFWFLIFFASLTTNISRSLHIYILIPTFTENLCTLDVSLILIFALFTPSHKANIWL